MKYLMSAKLGILLGELVIWVMSLLLLTVAAMAADPPRTLVPCEVLSVHDGDSFYVTFDMPFIDGLKIENREVRLQGADAWEVRGGRPGVVVTEEEKKKGAIARDAVAALLKSADAVYLEPRRPDDIREPHGRISAHTWIWKDGKLFELAPWLIANGHVRTK